LLNETILILYYSYPMLVITVLRHVDTILSRFMSTMKIVLPRRPTLEFLESWLSVLIDQRGIVRRYVLALTTDRKNVVTQEGDGDIRTYV
jgi:hypothetical protein